MNNQLIILFLLMLISISTQRLSILKPNFKWKIQDPSVRFKTIVRSPNSTGKSEGKLSYKTLNIYFTLYQPRGHYYLLQNQMFGQCSSSVNFRLSKLFE